MLRVTLRICLTSLLLLLTACAASNPRLSRELRPMHTVEEFDGDESVDHADDPWESFNRSMYKFNYEADRYVLLPVVKGYETVVPRPVRKGIGNFFSNVGEIRTLYNCILQAKAKKSLVTLGRFVTNSTIGIGGLFDPATAFGMRRQSETFDSTLAAWGVGNGPYLVLPVLGPNTLRSSGGFAVDAGIRLAVVTAIDPFGGTGAATPIASGTSGLEVVNMRYGERFRYYDSDYPFEYYMVRYLFSQHRDLELPR
ncbi:hypothetical protein GMSM_07840 [Geomonas sp. Red276]